MRDQERNEMGHITCYWPTSRLFSVCGMCTKRSLASDQCVASTCRWYWQLLATGRGFTVGCDYKQSHLWLPTSQSHHSPDVSSLKLQSSFRVRSVTSLIASFVGLTLANHKPTLILLGHCWHIGVCFLGCYHPNPPITSGNPRLWGSRLSHCKRLRPVCAASTFVPLI